MSEILIGSFIKGVKLSGTTLSKDANGAVNIAFGEAFSTEKAYAVGDYVTYSSKLWKCTTAHSAGAWDAEDFTDVTDSLLSVDGSGNIKDSGHKHSDYQAAGNYKTTQAAVSDPSVPSTGTTDALEFIDSISQDTNGVITPTKKAVKVVVASNTSTGTAGNDGLMTAAMAEKLNGIDAAVGNIIIPLQIIQKAGLITGATETIIDNPEFYTVLLDADDKIVMGIRHDLSVVGADVEDAFEFVMEQL